MTVPAWAGQDVPSRVATAVAKRRQRQPKGEPEPAPDAPAGMSAQLRPEGAPPPGVARARPGRDRSEPGEAAFDHWLKNELGRLYDATLSEPVPDDLMRLLDQATRKDGGKS